MQAFGAQDKARGATLTREQLLEEFLAKEKCVCSVDCQSYLLAKDFLEKNGFDGLLQAAALGSEEAAKRLKTAQQDASASAASKGSGS